MNENKTYEVELSHRETEEGYDSETNIFYTVEELVSFLLYYDRNYWDKITINEITKRVIFQ